MSMLGCLSRLIAMPVLVMGLVLQGGCATPARSGQMATQAVAPRAQPALLGKVVVGGVTGGKDTNPLLYPEVGNQQVREALIQSLQNAGYLSPDRDAATITLAAGIVGVDLPTSNSVTVNVLIRYVLANNEGGQRLFDELVSTTCGPELPRTFFGTTRLRSTEECAVRRNIAALLTKLSATRVN